MLFHELYRNLSCTEFMEVKSVMCQFIGSWFSSSSIVALLLTAINVCVCSVFPSVVDVDWRPDPFPSETLVRPFLNMPVQTSAAKHYRHNLLCISVHQASSAHCVLLFGACGKRSDHTDGISGARQLNEHGQSHPSL